MMIFIQTNLSYDLNQQKRSNNIKTKVFSVTMMHNSNKTHKKKMIIDHHSNVCGLTNNQLMM